MQVYLLIILLPLFAADIIIFFELRKLKNQTRKILLSMHLIFVALTVIALLYALQSFSKAQNGKELLNVGWVLYFFILFYIPKLVFMVFWALDVLVGTVKQAFAPKQRMADKGRRRFIAKAGVLAAFANFGLIASGALHERFNFKIQKVSVPIPNLPERFRGFKIVQISDVHLGTFGENYEDIARAVELINDEQADIVVHTGDMVNTFASEISNEWCEVFRKIKAKRGVYAVLGNHDYGHYANWDNKAQEEKNFQDIVDGYGKCGFQLLRNESVIFERGQDKLALLGIDNWGKAHGFDQEGNIEDALEGVPNAINKILLSHNPDFWEYNIKENNTMNIDLTLSGHTHGMQSGVNFFGKTYSLSRFIYKYWKGLYTYNDKHLYVNVGLGCVGIPLRSGMPPEITVITIHLK
ncbi:MAG: metallophosphoesterase [Bacteroidales bacterium]